MYIHNLQIREASSCRPANGAMSSDGVHTERWDVFLSADEDNVPLWEEGVVAMCEWNDWNYPCSKFYKPLKHPRCPRVFHFDWRFLIKEKPSPPKTT